MRKEPLRKEDKRPLNKDNFKKLVGIFKFILPYKWTFISGLILLMLSSFFLLTFPFLTGKLIDAASGKNNWIIKGVDTIALILIFILFLQGIFSFLRVYLFAQVSEKSMADIRYYLYHKMLGLPMSFYDTRRTGELISRITSDVTLLQETFSITLAEFVRQIATLMVGTAIIFATTPKLTLFMLAIFPLVVLVGLIFGRYIRRLSRDTQDQLATANVIVEETIQAINTVKSFTSELFEVNRYRHALNKVVNTALKAATYRGTFISFIIFILFGAIVAVMWYGANLVQSGDLSVGDLLSFILYTTFIGGSIAGLGDLYGQVQKAIGASERVLDIMGSESETAFDQETKQEGLVLGQIAYKQVSFAYPTRPDIQVMNKLDLSIKPGEKIALVGPSGSGKSTIIQLLMRFYEVDRGQILVDDQDIQQFDLHQYRKNIGIVPQEVILFGGSIRENIAYGKNNASFQEIREAAIKANALEFIESFPDGFETTVGERGVKLSGGQRQRIAIARAILKDPAILILDEATSSLDAESESLVQQALDELMKNRTTIIIAHRLATIRKVDKIFVISQGEVLESGTHEELLVKEGSYSNLVKLQLELE